MADGFILEPLDDDEEEPDDFDCCHHGIGFDEFCEECDEEDELLENASPWPDEYDGIAEQ